MTTNPKSAAAVSILRLLAIPVVTASAWVSLEWLFFVTKPSFMSLYTAAESLGVLAVTVLILSAALLATSLPFAVSGWILSRLTAVRWLIGMTAMLPAIAVAALASLVVIDNFTLTLFGWGVRNSSGATIWIYRALTLGLLAWAAWLLQGFLFGRYTRSVSRVLFAGAAFLVLISVPLLFMVTTSPQDVHIETTGAGDHRPNILILSGDGIAASHMSLYGYERQTTPFMDAVQEEFLIAENHFTNASDTGGSVVSLLSGKLPTTTKVVYPPDALRGSDSFQHLPGMLKRLGYYNADISMRHYADPYDLNMRNGFAEANYRKLSESGGRLVAELRRYTRLNPASLLVDRMTERVRERIRHVWRNQPMQDPLAEVNRPDRRWVLDSHRMAEIRRLVNEAPRPFFLHVHTMGTHGEVFKPTVRVWSREEDYEKKWDVNGYDDAILDFDRMLEEIYTLLEDEVLLDSTILVVSSDHGFVHNAIQRLPLLIRLPGAAKSGWLGGNTQRLDIAPTLLDALGIEPRDWMEGVTLLDPAFDGRSRDIFASGSAGNRAPDGNFWSVVSPQPPWYTLGRLFYVHCDQGFTLWLDRMALTEEAVEGSTLDCDWRLTKSEAKAVMLTHLREKGYSWEEAP